MWSLAVEEHFYLIFPLLFVWMNRARLAYRTQALCLTGLAAFILSWRIYLMLHHVNLLRLTSATDTRIDSILFGCIMALAFNPMFEHDKLPSTHWSVVGGCVLIASLLFHNPFYRFTFHYTLQGMALVPIFVAAICHGDTWFRWLNLRWVRYLGTLTYSLYLIHDSAIHLLLLHIHSRLLVTFMALLASLAFAILMNLLVERPLIAWRQRLTVDAHTAKA
jgi:peptidoglycan/LPS O-acetylase OafA/YrhL